MLIQNKVSSMKNVFLCGNSVGEKQNTYFLYNERYVSLSLTRSQTCTHAKSYSASQVLKACCANNRHIERTKRGHDVSNPHYHCCCCLSNRDSRPDTISDSESQKSVFWRIVFFSIWRCRTQRCLTPRGGSRSPFARLLRWRTLPTSRRASTVTSTTPWSRTEMCRQPEIIISHWQTLSKITWLPGGFEPSSAGMKPIQRSVFKSYFLCFRTRRKDLPL